MLSHCRNMNSIKLLLLGAGRYKNRPEMTFDDAGCEPDQEFEMHSDSTGALEYVTKYVSASSGKTKNSYFKTKTSYSKTKAKTVNGMAFHTKHKLLGSRSTELL